MKEYKISMRQGDRWNVLDAVGSLITAYKSYEGYVKMMPHREFRLEEHVVEIIKCSSWDDQ